jgi:hypothetical protein
LTVGESQAFSLTDEVGNTPSDVTWMLEPDDGTAIVDSSGVVTALAPGSVTLRVAGLEAEVTVVELRLTEDGEMRTTEDGTPRYSEL